MTAWLDRLSEDVRRRRSDAPERPFVIALAGGVASGKSTVAKALATRLRKDGLTVEVVGTDGFLFPNAELDRRGLMGRKGFPDSHDTERLTGFMEQLTSGASPLKVPTYSHETYDIGLDRSFARPDVVLIEGLVALQPWVAPVDLGLFLDVDEDDLITWYIERFMDLERWDAPRLADRLAEVGGDPEALAGDIWSRINGPNLHDHILPTRARADLVLHKDERHAVRVLAPTSKPA